MDQIKSQIIGGQDQLNKTAVDMLAARPEMIARQATLSEFESAASFSGKIAQRLGHSLAKGEKWKSRFIAGSLTDSMPSRFHKKPIVFVARNAHMLRQGSRHTLSGACIHAGMSHWPCNAR